MNSVNLIGRVGKNPELKHTTNNIAVTRFSIAVRGNKDNTIWVRVVAWQNTADLIVRYVRKGDLIGISGRLDVREYEKEDEKRTIYEVVADRVDFCDNKRDNNTDSETNETGILGEYETLVEDDDLPF